MDTTTKDDPPAYTAAQHHHQNLGYDQETNNGHDLATPYPTDLQQFPHMSYLSIDPVYFTQQQSQQVPPQPGSNQAWLYRSLNFATILSCAVFWWCGAIFGFIAFMFAMTGQSYVARGDEDGAVKFLRASYACSIIGLITAVVIIAIVVVVYASRNCDQQLQESCPFGYYYDAYNCRLCH